MSVQLGVKKPANVVVEKRGGSRKSVGDVPSDLGGDGEVFRVKAL